MKTEPLKPDSPAVVVKNLGLTLGAKKIFENLNFVLKKNTTVALLGTNGVGKTTLLKIILGVLQPSVGQLEILGKSSLVLKPTQIAKVFGYMPALLQQQIDCSVFNFVSLISDIRDCAKIKRQLEEFGASHLATKSIGDLSAGELRRVYLTCAFAHQPQIVLLDEPGAFLDLKSETQLCKVIERQQKHWEQTVVIAVNDLNSPLLELASEVLVLQSENQYWFGSKDQFYHEQMLENLFGKQVRVDAISGRSTPFLSYDL